MKVRNLLLASPLVICLTLGCDSTPAPATPSPASGDAAANGAIPKAPKKGKKELSQATGPEGLVD